MKKTGKKQGGKNLSIVLALAVCLGAAVFGFDADFAGAGLFSALSGETDYSSSVQLTADDIPSYSGEDIIQLDQNKPSFTEKEMTTEDFETYSDLDSLGRCGTAYSNICEERMPTEKRGSIGMIKPSGWHTVRYDDLITTKYLYNRCHLIAFQLAGENANEKNLITGTRQMNEEMIPYENQVADYVRETGNHVLYRVMPLFEGENLLATGVEMEAFSVEDDGEGVSFHIFIYNVQPGVEIDYATGESKRA